MLWMFILLISFILFILGILYICKSLRNFGIKRKLTPYIIVILFCLLLTILLNITTMIIIVIHYLVVWILIDLIFYIIKKVTKKNIKNYLPGLITIIFVTIYIGYGIYNVYDVKKTNYTFTSNKINNNYTIAVISDSHMGTTFNALKFKEHLNEIEKNNIDMLLVVGDFVDDGTTKEEMIKASKFLGEVKTKYGVYFSHGNHDKGYYKEKRGYNSQDLENELTKNNVKVLKDESTLINDEIYLTGRKDYEDRSRLSIDNLVSKLDKNKYIIVLDHQPVDYDNEEKSNVDLVLSGHTHGGQLIPINYMNTMLSENDSVYGYKKINNTNFIVTSGISDWELKIKTGCISEYVIINLNKVQ